MLKKSIKVQSIIIFKQRLYIIGFFIIFTFVLVNYFNNIKIYNGYDVSQMIHPTKLSLLNTYGKIGFYFMQYFPFILVIPASFSFFPY